MTFLFALLFSVTIQECYDGVCAKICDGSITARLSGQLVYQVQCSDDIFSNGFDS